MNSQDYDPIRLTSDGVFCNAEEVSGRALPTLRGTLVVRLKPDELEQFRNRLNGVGVVGKSGLCQAGVEVLGYGTPDLEGPELRVGAEVTGCMGSVHKRILNVIQDRSKTHPLALGRTLLLPKKSLSEGEVRDAINGNQLLLPEGATIEEDGVITLPLSKIHYLLALDNLEAEESILRFLRMGKHGLGAIRDINPKRKPSHLAPNGFYLGATHISLGAFDAVIEPEQEVSGQVQPHLRHLSARVLDGVRTTGLHVPRQVELLNIGDTTVSLRDTRIRLRLFHSGIDTQKAAQRLITPKTLRDGVSFHDVTGLLLRDRVFLDLFDQVGRRKSHKKPAGLILSRGRSEKFDWRPTRRLQFAHFKEGAKGLMGGSQGFNGGANSDVVHDVAKSLSFIGGAQEAGTMFVAHGFPDLTTAQALFESGVGSFTAQHLRWGSRGSRGSRGKGYHDIYFDESLYNGMRVMEAAGAIFHMVVPECKAQDIEAHVRQFYKGLWIRPKDKERLDKVRCSIAMYGSAVDAVDPIVGEQLPGFMRRMKHLFGEELAIIHGKGPGVMLAADKAAEDEEIVRIGVGISVEELNQAPNFKPDAMVDFGDRDRLTRQKFMDDLATFKIFNIGGAGTLEEAAITLCSQKLGKNIPTPIIFVDPLGLGENEEPLFMQLKRQIETLVTEKKVTKGKAQATFRLLAAHNAGFIHMVQSYDEAADIIQDFARDPIAYYEKIGLPYNALKRAYENGVEHLAGMGFQAPRFLTKKTVNHDRIRERLAA